MRNMSKKIFLCLSLLCMGQVSADAGWFDTLKNGLNWTGKVGLICIGAYGLQWTKRLWDFYSLKKALRYASSDNPTCENFKFSAWKKQEWRYAADLENATKDVQSKLKHDATTRSALHSKILKRYSEKVIITSELVKELIDEEIQQLERTLCAVGSCTNAPAKVIKFLEEEKQKIFEESHCYTITENLKYLKTLNKEELKSFMEYIKNECAKQFPFKRIVYFSYIPNYHLWFPPYHVWCPQFAPHYERATKLYCNLLKHYIRLSVLKEIADTMDWTTQKKPSIHVDVTTKTEAEKEA